MARHLFKWHWSGRSIWWCLHGIKSRTIEKYASIMHLMQIMFGNWWIFSSFLKYTQFCRPYHVKQTLSCGKNWLVTQFWSSINYHSMSIFQTVCLHTIFNTINHAIVQNPFHTTAIYDIIMESQQFECNRFKLNPVLRMAIMRKVI